MTEYKKSNAFLMDDIKNIMSFGEDYKAFLGEAKTEREAVKWVKNAIHADYREVAFGDKLEKGEKCYMVNKNKCIAMMHIGTEPIDNGIKIVVAHIDSPRLDLKQVPLYEEAGTAYFKTHYYGGIRKYQWLTIPLALHGVVALMNGTTVDINIGESDQDPIFYISDLLPHLAHGDDDKKISEVFQAEKLNVICGGLDTNENESIKAGVLKLLNEKYGIEEEDFLSAEIEVIPANKPRDVGFDRAYIAGYGHDDKVCAYTAYRALLDANPSETSIVFLVDKEEIGSEGVAGAQSSFIMDVLEHISDNFGADFAKVRAHSICLSADVSSAYDTDYKEVFEDKNCAYLSKGVAMCKYTGARGKSGSNDAGAELVAYVRRVFNNANVVWQTAELGKVDCGGGGTVAMFFSRHNIDTIDLGVPVMSMHSPYELISKADLFSAYAAYKAFFNADNNI